MIFSLFKSKEKLQEDILEYEVGDIVKVVKPIDGLDILVGDSYSIKEINEDKTEIKIDHNLGTRFDIFLSADLFKIIHSKKSLKENNITSKKLKM